MDVKSNASPFQRLIGGYWSKRRVVVNSKPVDMHVLSRRLYKKFRKALKKYEKWQIDGQSFQFNTSGLQFDSRSYSLSVAMTKRGKVYVYSWFDTENENETDGGMEEEAIVCIEETVTVSATVQRGLSIQERNGWALLHVGTMASGKVKSSQNMTKVNIVLPTGELLDVRADGSLGRSGAPGDFRSQFRLYQDATHHPFPGKYAAIQSVAYPDMFMTFDDANSTCHFARSDGNFLSPSFLFRFSSLDNLYNVVLTWKGHQVSIYGTNKLSFVKNEQ